MHTAIYISPQALTSLQCLTATVGLFGAVLRLVAVTDYPPCIGGDSSAEARP